MGKWTERGYQAYTLSYYKEQLQKLFVSAFGEQFKLDDTLPQGVLIQRLAELLYNADMDAVEVMSVLNINTTSGMWLDIIGGLRGIPRLGGSPQYATITIKSNSSQLPYTIPSGTIFSSGGNSFTISESQIITVATKTIVVSNIESGNSSLTIGSKMTCDLTQITDIEVVGLADGQPDETDADYRARLNKTYSVSNNTMRWVEMKIAESPLVRTTGFGYNDSSSTVNSRPPHTSEWMAVPKEGVDNSLFASTIAKIIVDNKVPSSQTYGNTSATVQDLYGSQKTVNFTIPQKVDIEISIAIETPTSTGVLDLSSVTKQKEDIVAYINNLRIGEDIPMAKILAFVVGDPGYDVVSYSIRKVGASQWTNNANFVIGDREYASCNVANIKIGG